MGIKDDETLWIMGSEGVLERTRRIAELRQEQMRGTMQKLLAENVTHHKNSLHFLQKQFILT